MLKNNELGKIGEKVAKKYLIGKGFEFITEIDLVFKNQDILLFIEVKTRRNKKDLETAIGFRKVKNLKASAEIFLEKEDASFKEMQFDVIFVTLDAKGEVVEIGHRPDYF